MARTSIDGVDLNDPKGFALMFAKVMEEITNQRYFRRKGAITLNASGAGYTSINVQGQYDWILERVTISGAGAANALVTLYENEATAGGADPADTLEVIQLGSVGIYSDAFKNCIFVPSNSHLVIGVTGGVASEQVTYNLQVRMVKHH
jgi:hypothetical protein